MIALAALPLVWWRMVVVSVALLLVPRFWSGLSAMAPRMMAIYAGIGVLVMLHWVMFYASIKLSNASVAATCMALIPVFVALIEPFLVRRRFEIAELLFGLAVIPGVTLVVGGTPAEMRSGIAIGVLSALFAALFSSLNKRHISAGDDVLTVTGMELGAGVLMLSVFAWVLPASIPVVVVPSAKDAWLLAFLAMGCTLLPFALSLVALRQLSAFSAALAVNLEPIYAIALAMLLLGEQHELSGRFYFGVVIILAVVFLHPWVARRLRPLTAAPRR
jgi:drug/metabolite transporter (DMT)-like permease